jgi:hypothetical protein
MPSMAIFREYAGTGLQLCAAVAALFATAIIWTADAGAVSTRVKLACAKDYYAHCSHFRPDTPEVRRCMREAGEKLSSRCVNALVAAGEVSQREVAQRASNIRD